VAFFIIYFVFVLISFFLLVFTKISLNFLYVFFVISFFIFLFQFNLSALFFVLILIFFLWLFFLLNYIYNENAFDINFCLFNILFFNGVSVLYFLFNVARMDYCLLLNNLDFLYFFYENTKSNVFFNDSARGFNFPGPSPKGSILIFLLIFFEILNTMYSDNFTDSFNFSINNLDYNSTILSKDKPINGIILEMRIFNKASLLAKPQGSQVSQPIPVIRTYVPPIDKVK
jgi:hypothetical protein